MLEDLVDIFSRPIKPPKPSAGVQTEGIALLQELRGLTFLEERSEALARAGRCLQRARELRLAVEFRTRFEAHQLLLEMESGSASGELLQRTKMPSQAILHLNEALGYCGQPVLGRHLAQQYIAKWPAHAGLRQWAAIVESTRSDAPCFQDRLSDDLQVIRTEGATTTILVFTGLKHALGVPLNVAYRCWFSDLKANIVFLRDFQNCLYVGGIQSIGGHQETCARLKSIIDELQTSRLVSVGFSAGNFGALYYGALLNADHIVALAGPTSLDIGLQFAHKQSFQRVRNRHLAGEMPWPDVRQMLIEKPHIAVRCFYSEGHPADARQARNLLGISNVEVTGIPNSGDHYTLGVLHEEGRLMDIFKSAIAGESTAKGREV